MMHINWKKTLIVILDLALAVYLVLAMTSFNKPDETAKLCTKVSINIADENTNGFLSAKEIKRILEKNKLYPLEKHMQNINPRDIEDVLKTSSFVNTVQCYKTQNGPGRYIKGHTVNGNDLIKAFGKLFDFDQGAKPP